MSRRVNDASLMVGSAWCLTTAGSQLELEECSRIYLWSCPCLCSSKMAKKFFLAPTKPSTGWTGRGMSNICIGNVGSVSAMSDRA